MKIGTAGSIVLTEEQKQELAELGHALFACPELGFKEVKSSEILTSFLIKEGFSVETGLSVTGLKAGLGTGDGYHIALVADKIGRAHV